MQKPLKDAEAGSGLPVYRSWQPLEWVVPERTHRPELPSWSWAWQSLEADAEEKPDVTTTVEDSSRK